MQVSSSTNAIGICAQSLAVIRVILGVLTLLLNFLPTSPIAIIAGLNISHHSLKITQHSILDFSSVSIPRTILRLLLPNYFFGSNGQISSRKLSHIKAEFLQEWAFPLSNSAFTRNFFFTTPWI